jgi:glucose/arabinose dehydrogenase
VSPRAVPGHRRCPTAGAALSAQQSLPPACAGATLRAAARSIHLQSNRHAARSAARGTDDSRDRGAAEDSGYRATHGIDAPVSLAFLPDGTMLVTERPGGCSDSQRETGSVADRRRPGWFPVGLNGLMDVAVHPRFSETRFVYLTYSKQTEGSRSTAALARGRFDGHSLEDVQDLFVAQPNASGTTRIAFGKDGTLYMSIQGASGNRAQDPNDIAGKILRLNDDGSVPKDNPFVDRPGYRPEIFTLGHRSNVGIEVHPETGAMWTTTDNGGDGSTSHHRRNYGWPVVYGHLQAWVTEVRGVDGTAADFLDAFGAASGSCSTPATSSRRGRATSSVGGMRTGGSPHGARRTHRLQRRREMRRESLLTELKNVSEVRPDRTGSSMSAETKWSRTSARPGAAHQLRREPSATNG